MFIEPAKSLSPDQVDTAAKKSITTPNLVATREAARARLLGYIPSVNSTVYKITDGSSVGEDLKQELALKILMMECPEEIESPAAFLRKVVMRTHLDHLRSEKRRKHRETNYSAESTRHEYSPSRKSGIRLDAKLNLQEYSAFLVKAFEELPAKDKQAVLLRLAGASLRDAAIALRIDEVTAGVRLSRALANIRGTLSPYANLINEREDARRAFDVLLSSETTYLSNRKRNSRGSVDLDKLPNNTNKARRRIRKWNIPLESKARLISATYGRVVRGKINSDDKNKLRKELSETLEFLQKYKRDLIPSRIIDTCVRLLRRDKIRWVLFTLRAFQVDRSESALELLKLKRESIVNLNQYRPKELVSRINRLNISDQSKTKLKDFVKGGNLGYFPRNATPQLLGFLNKVIRFHTDTSKILPLEISRLAGRMLRREKVRFVIFLLKAYNACPPIARDLSKAEKILFNTSIKKKKVEQSIIELPSSQRKLLPKRLERWKISSEHKAKLLNFAKRQFALPKAVPDESVSALKQIINYHTDRNEFPRELAAVANRLLGRGKVNWVLFMLKAYDICPNLKRLASTYGLNVIGNRQRPHRRKRIDVIGLMPQGRKKLQERLDRWKIGPDQKQIFKQYAAQRFAVPRTNTGGLIKLLSDAVQHSVAQNKFPENLGCVAEKLIARGNLAWVVYMLKAYEVCPNLKGDLELSRQRYFNLNQRVYLKKTDIISLNSSVRKKLPERIKRWKIPDTDRQRFLSLAANRLNFPKQFTQQHLDLLQKSVIHHSEITKLLPSLLAEVALRLLRRKKYRWVAFMLKAYGICPKLGRTSAPRPTAEWKVSQRQQRKALQVLNLQPGTRHLLPSRISRWKISESSKVKLLGQTSKQYSLPRSPDVGNIKSIVEKYRIAGIFPEELAKTAHKLVGRGRVRFVILMLKAFNAYDSQDNNGKSLDAPSALLSNDEILDAGNLATELIRLWNVSSFKELLSIKVVKSKKDLFDQLTDPLIQSDDLRCSFDNLVNKRSPTQFLFGQTNGSQLLVSPNKNNDPRTEHLIDSIATRLIRDYGYMVVPNATISYTELSSTILGKIKAIIARRRILKPTAEIARQEAKLIEKAQSMQYLIEELIGRRQTGESIDCTAIAHIAAQKS